MAKKLKDKKRFLYLKVGSKRWKDFCRQGGTYMTEKALGEGVKFHHDYLYRERFKGFD